MSGLYSNRIDTPKGVFLIIFHSKALARIYFPGQEPTSQYPLRKLPWETLEDDLKRYLCGEIIDWSSYPLDSSYYQPFTAKLLSTIKEIPHGEVWTYRESAERAGSPKAWRAAGQALKANRHPIIVPCHRVVASGGKIGGFSGPPGWKQMLLELEAGHKGADDNAFFKRR